MKPSSSFLLDSLNSLFPWHWIESSDVQPRLLFTFFAAFLLFLYVKLSRRRLQLPPGPTGVPLLGNLPFLDPEIHTYFAELGRRYGPIVKLQLGQKIGIVINSPSVACQVVKDHDLTFANRDVTQAAKVATYGVSDIAWSPYGPEWRMLRKVCVLKMLNNATLNSVYELRRREVRNTVGYLYNRAGSPVNIGEQVFLTTFNVVTSMLWGGTVEGNEKHSLVAEFRQTVSDLTDLLLKPNISDFFPILARFDLQGIEKQMHKLVPRFDNMFDKMINQRLSMTADGDDGANAKKNDFLQFLLELKDESNSKTALTMTQLKALLLDMIIGGTDTTSNTVQFAMAEMMKNPQILKKAREELVAVVGDENIVEESHIPSLPYLKALMKETLRLHPILPVLMPHSPSETTMISNYTIPKGSQVLINVWAIHRDPNHWEKPLEFDPERFLNDKWDFGGSDLRYFPFGSGRRNCAGIGMAERMVLYSLATFLHSFDWKLKEGEKLDISEKFGIVLRMKIPLVAIPTPRLSNPCQYHF